MTVRARLVIFGAALPTTVLVVAVVVAGWLFEAAQLRDLDRRLLAQAAVESVGLFDGTDGKPHVHLPESPIAAEVAEFAPLTALYDARGELVVDVPDRALVPSSLPSRGAIGSSSLDERVLGGIRRRTLELGALDQHGERYTLWLGASLAPLAATMMRYYITTFSVVGVLGLVLAAVQLAVARRLARRITTMVSFLPHLHEGATATLLPPDAEHDELAALREVLRDVAGRLADARLEQDRLLASAAHELRTPLTVLRTEVDLALRRDRSADQLREAMRLVRSDVDRIAELATALLDLHAVRHVDFQRSPGDLVPLLREACAGLRTMGEAREIDVRLATPVSARARFDERAVRQAVDNLVGNALKHAPARTAVDVELATHDTCWEISITDRGPGVPDDAAERIFEPFQRLAVHQPGAGLGLAIAREVAQRHGGRCWLDPAYREGARFVFSVPTFAEPT